MSNRYFALTLCCALVIGCGSSSANTEPTPAPVQLLPAQSAVTSITVNIAPVVWNFTNGGQKLFSLKPGTGGTLTMVHRGVGGRKQLLVGSGTGTSGSIWRWPLVVGDTLDFIEAGQLKTRLIMAPVTNVTDGFQISTFSETAAVTQTRINTFVTDSAPTIKFQPT